MLLLFKTNSAVYACSNSSYISPTMSSPGFFRVCYKSQCYLYNMTRQAVATNPPYFPSAAVSCLFQDKLHKLNNFVKKVIMAQDFVNLFVRGVYRVFFPQCQMHKDGGRNESGH